MPMSTSFAPGAGVSVKTESAIFSVDNRTLVAEAHARFGRRKIGVNFVREHHSTDITIIGVANLEIHCSIRRQLAHHRELAILKS